VALEWAPTGAVHPGSVQVAPGGNGWARRPIDGAGEGCHAATMSADPLTAARGRATGTEPPATDLSGAGAGLRSQRRGFERSLLATAGSVVASATLVAVLLSLPASLHLTTSLIGTGSDPTQNVWNVVWVRGWLDGHHGLYFTRQLLYPDGANLAWMTLALPSSIVAALLVPLIGLAGAYNVALLVTLAADGVAMYVLGRKVGLAPPAAALAGLAFETGPYLTHQLGGHLHMVGAYPIPLAVALLWGILERPRPAPARFVLLGALVALAAYDAPDYALYVVLAGIVVALFHPATSGRIVASILERWWGWLLAGVVALGLVAPFLDALLAGPLAVGSAAVSPSTTPWVVDLVGFLVPPPAGAFRFLGGRERETLLVQYAFPGFFALGAFVVLLRWRERIPAERRGLLRLCLVGMIAFAVLSLGTHLHADGWSFPVPLPYLLLAHLPGFADTLPARLTVLVALFSSLLVGLATELVVTQIRHRRAEGTEGAKAHRLERNASRWALGGATFAGAVLLALSVPYPFPSFESVGAAFVPSVRAGGGTVLFVPAQVPWTADVAQSRTDPQRGYWYMYADAELGLPTPEGYVSRLPLVTTARVDRSAVLRYVTLMQRTDPRDRSPAEAVAARALGGFLRRMDVHSIVLRTSELTHPVADAGWFVGHAGVPTHLTRFPGGIWVLSLESASG